MSEFKREDRYIIIKRSDLKKVPVAYRSALVDPMFSLLSHLPHRECVVVEHDWPEYHLVWAMIEHRMAGKPVPNFNDWRRADELQQRLTVADQQIDDLRAELAANPKPDPVLCKFYDVTDYPGLVRELVGHVAQLQESAKRNVKPWEDTFPATLLPAYIERVNAANAAAQPQGEPVALTNAQRRAADYKEQQAFNDWAWNKEGEAIGRMDGQAAAIEAWHARAKLAEQPKPVAVVPERLVMTDGLHTYEYVTGHNDAIDKMMVEKS